MRNVTRPQKPGSLRDNAKRWSRDLELALRRKRPDRLRLRKLVNRYKCDDVRDALDAMYRGLCCYCEAQIGVVAFAHIEHRKPKEQFPRTCFAWANLHLGCPKCNQAKGKHWSAASPILDSVVDVPIDEHLTYEIRDVSGVSRKPKTARGRTTIDDAALNRQELREARTRVAMNTWSLIADLNEAPNSLGRTELCLELELKEDGPYGSLVAWLRAKFLRAA